MVTLNKIKFPGADELPPRMLKEGAEEISEPLTIIFEKSWRTGEVPIDRRRKKWSLFSKKGGERKNEMSVHSCFKKKCTYIREKTVRCVQSQTPLFNESNISI